MNRKTKEDTPIKVVVIRSKPTDWLERYHEALCEFMPELRSFGDDDWQMESAEGERQ